MLPKMMVRPISAPSSAAAASGPGVGGTMAWVSCSEPTSPMDMTLTVTPIILAAECTSGFRITYATSEKMAIPRTNPVNVSANGMRVEPTARTMVRVMV